MTSISCIFNTYLCKIGQRLNFSAQCSQDELIVASVQAFCHHYELSLRDATRDELSPLDAFVESRHRVFVIEAPVVTWINRRRRRRQQQHADKEMSNDRATTLAEDVFVTNDDGHIVMKVIVRILPPNIIADCAYKDPHHDGLFETWGCLFKRDVLGNIHGTRSS